MTTATADELYDEYWDGYDDEASPNPPPELCTCEYPIIGRSTYTGEYCDNCRGLL